MQKILSRPRKLAGKKTHGRNITGLVYPCDNFKVDNNAVIKTSADESHTPGVAVFRN